MGRSNNAVLTPIAQIGRTVAEVVTAEHTDSVGMIECNGYDYGEQLNQAVHHIMQSQLPSVEKLLLVLLLRNGLRVSEICNTGNIKIMSKYCVTVYCSKNKVYRECYTAEASELIDECSNGKNLYEWNRNRYYYYRQLKGLLPNVETSRTGNNAVTHAARNIKAQQIYEQTNSTAATRASIGNTSNNATARYVKKSQRRAFQKRGAEGNISGSVATVTASKRGVIRQRK